MQAFPLIAQNGWKFESVARLDGDGPYLNSADDTSDVTPQSVGVLAAASPSSSAASTSGSSTSRPSSTGSSGSGHSTSSGSSANPGATGASQDHNGAMSRMSWQSAAFATCLSVLAAAFALS